MPFAITILPDLHIVKAKGEGALRLADFLDGRGEILKQQSFEPSMDLLVDLTSVSDLSLEFEDIHYLSRSRAPFNSTSRCAIIAVDDFIYGLGRMFELLKAGERQVRVFRNESDAWRWLGIEREERLA